MDAIQKKPQLWILIFLISLANVLGVLYTAALPNITTFFQVTKSQVQQTISLYLLGCLFSQFFYAPIANALGRKSAIYIGCSLAIMGSIFCLLGIWKHDFSLLLFGRALTAFGAACGLVLTNTLIADAYSLTESKKMLSYIVSCFAIFPAVSIAIGGFITEYISWKGCFIFMLFYSMFVLFICIYLPETGTGRNLAHFNLKKILTFYFRQLCNWTALLYALIVACASIILYVFAAEAPFIALKELNISADRFGLYNLIPNIGFLVGGLSSATVSHRISSKWLLLIASAIFLFFSLLMWVFFETGLVNLVTLFVIPLFIFSAAPIVIAQGQSLTLHVSKDKAYASSLMYVIQYFWMFFSVYSLGFFRQASALPMVYSISGFLMIILWFIVQKFHRNSHS